MSQQQLDYQSPGAISNRGRRTTVAAAVVAFAVLAANGVLLAMASSDRSWGALGIAIMVGPITNGILLLASLACIPLVKSKPAGASFGVYLAASIGGPVAAVVVDFAAIGSMGLHGG